MINYQTLIKNFNKLTLVILKLHICQYKFNTIN